MDSDYFSSILINIQFSPLTTTAIVALSITAILLYFSALLSGSEVALQSLSAAEKEEIEEKKNHQDQTIYSFLSRYEEVQIGIITWERVLNISVIALPFYALNQFISFTTPYLGFLLIITISIFILILLGDIIPKIYAKNNPLGYLRKNCHLIYILEKTVGPLSSLISKFTSSLNDSPKKRSSGDVSVDELSKALELTSEELIEEKDMLKGIINLYNKTAVEIMTPRMDIANLDISDKFKKVLSYVVEVEYSRIPVYSGNADNIKGILYIKDLLPYLKQENNFYWQKLIRPAFFIPESKKIDDLLEEFRTNKNHMAVVVDEYGGTSGIVTMEDILEEIVGEINDEYDDDEDPKYICLKDGSFIFDGKILLTDFFRITDIKPKTFGKLTDEVDTLAGLILEIKGDFPDPEETILLAPYLFQILEMDNKRILKIKFIKEKENNETGDES